MTTAIKSKNLKPKIQSITINYMIDDAPDTSLLGKYSDKWENGAIKRHNAPRDEYQYFIPAMSYSDHWYALHKIGYSKGDCDYLARSYNYQDFNRMEKLNNGDWCYIGIQAQAQIIVKQQLQTITSFGLYGIESDSDKSYLAEIENEQITDLKLQLKALNVDMRNFDKIEIERKEL